MSQPLAYTSHLLLYVQFLYLTTFYTPTIYILYIYLSIFSLFLNFFLCLRLQFFRSSFSINQNPSSEFSPLSSSSPFLLSIFFFFLFSSFFPLCFPLNPALSLLTIPDQILAWFLSLLLLSSLFSSRLSSLSPSPDEPRPDPSLVSSDPYSNNSNKGVVVSLLASNATALLHSNPKPRTYAVVLHSSCRSRLITDPIYRYTENR